MHHKTAILGAVVFVCFLISSHTGSMWAYVCFAAAGAMALTDMLIMKNKTALLVFTGAAAAFLFYGIYLSLWVEPVGRMAGGEYDMTAVLTSVSAPDNDVTYITAEGTADGVPVKLAFYYADIGAREGDTVEMRVKLYAPAVSANYNGDHNYARGIFVRAYPGYMTVTRPNDGFSVGGAVSAYSEYLRDVIREYLPEEEGELLTAMCFGDKSRLETELSDAVARSGLSHMTAVSGMHISLIVTAVMSLLSPAMLRRHRFAGLAAVTCLAAVFMVFFNMTASVRRSGIMLVIYYASRTFRRRSSPADSLGAAVLLILLAEPCACRDTGLMLSVCGTLGAGVLAPRLSRAVRSRVRLPFRSDMPFVCVCASYATLPLSALIFGRFPVVSVLSSLAVYPMFFGAVILVMAAALTGGLLAPAVLLPAGLLVKAMIAVIRFFGGARFACVPVNGDWLVPFLAVTAAFISAAALISRRSRRAGRVRAVSAVVSLCAFAGLVTAQRVYDSGITRIGVYSDGKNWLVTVADGAGVSAFCSDVNGRLSSEAYSALSEYCADGFDLLCVLAGGGRGSVHSRAFDDVKAAVKQYPSDTETAYDIGGRYKVTVFPDAVETKINGVTLLMTDAGSATEYGGYDIAVWGGYKKAANFGVNGITILCDKRYGSVGNAYNAYFDSIGIEIDAQGRVYVRRA